MNAERFRQCPCRLPVRPEETGHVNMWRRPWAPATKSNAMEEVPPKVAAAFWHWHGTHTSLALKSLSILAWALASTRVMELKSPTPAPPQPRT